MALPEEDSDALVLQDFEPERARFHADVMQGLRQARKTLPCKYFYDKLGSQLFDRICELPEYYPTRTELGIMEQHAGEMGEAFEAHPLLVEFGSGSSRKIRLLLDHLEEPAGYVPVDISREHLMESAERLAQEYPKLPVLPVCADFTRPFELPEPDGPVGHTVVYFPGSTIGNFETEPARAFLAHTATLCGPAGGLLIGVDLVKKEEILLRAYDDSEGVTAAFNLNLLARINRELEGDFDLERFEHRSLWNPDASRVEMHLVSKADQTVRIGEETVTFDEGESIHTENSHKYTLESFAALAAEARFEVHAVWTDPEELFSVQHLVVA